MNIHKHPHSTWKVSLTLLLLFAVLPADAIAETSFSDLPDPTRPLGTTAAPVKKDFARGLKVQSILHSRNRKSAVINGYIKYIGSHVNGGRIIDIRHDSVVISHNGKLYTLYLNASRSVSQRGTRQ